MAPKRIRQQPSSMIWDRPKSGDALRLEVKADMVRVVWQIRKWLDRLHSRKKERYNWQRPAGLTDDRRVELQAKIQDWRESRTREPLSREAQEQLHGKAQEMIRNRVVTAVANHRRQQHREALLARIDMDASLLLNAPALADIDTDSEDLTSLLKSFTSHSVPVATKARLDHAAELRLLEEPWWRKLGDEYQDSKYSVEDDSEDTSWKVF